MRKVGVGGEAYALENVTGAVVGGVEAENAEARWDVRGVTWISREGGGRAALVVERLASVEATQWAQDGQ